MSTNSDSLLTGGDVRVFILRTLTATYDPAASKAGNTALASLWSRQKEDGSFPLSDGCGEAGTIGLMVPAYRPWVHVGYRYLGKKISEANKATTFRIGFEGI